MAFCELLSGAVTSDFNQARPVGDSQLKVHMLMTGEVHLSMPKAIHSAA